jgi:hypothetical protein
MCEVESQKCKFTDLSEGIIDITIIHASPLQNCLEIRISRIGPFSFLADKSLRIITEI